MFSFLLLFVVFEYNNWLSWHTQWYIACKRSGQSRSICKKNNYYSIHFQTLSFYFYERLLKPLGGFTGYTSEWRELAEVISRVNRKKKKKKKEKSKWNFFYKKTKKTCLRFHHITLVLIILVSLSNQEYSYKHETHKK